MNSQTKQPIEENPQAIKEYKFDQMMKGLKTFLEVNNYDFNITGSFNDQGEYVNINIQKYFHMDKQDESNG